MKHVNWQTILFCLFTVALIGLTARQLTAGPSYDVRPKDKLAAQRNATSPDGKGDEKQALPDGNVIGGNGIVEPAERETRVSAPTAGLVHAIVVKESDHVKQGDVMAELDDAVEVAQAKAAEADVASARANLDRTLHGQRVEDREAVKADAGAARARAALSKSELSRADTLIKTGAISKEELDQKRQAAEADEATARAAEERFRSAANGSRYEDVAAARAQLAASEGRLEQAKAEVERRFVRAPYDGEVLQVKARVGEYYTPGSSEPILVLGDTSKLRVRMDVDERDIGKVKLGGSAYAVVDAYPGKRFHGKVTELGRRMGRKNVRTDEPTERLDTKILEVVIDLDPTDAACRSEGATASVCSGLVPGLRVTSYVETGSP